MVDPRTLTRLLIISDNETMRNELRDALQDFYLVLESRSGVDGIDLAIDTNPNIVLIDLELSGLTGFEVATRMRTMVHETPLLAIADPILKSTREFGLAVGFSGYLWKPVNAVEYVKIINEFLGGRVDPISNRDSYLIAFQSELAQRVEEQVREMHNVTARATFLVEQNNLIIEMLRRRQRLLENAAMVSKIITSILDLEELLSQSVNVIVGAYEFYYAGIFLLNEDKKWAVLRSGSGEAGKAMLEAQHKLEIGGNSMIGDAIESRQAKIALDVGAESTHFKNPYLPDTRSEMALPLIVRDVALGALTIQSDQQSAFNEDDITALQTMADQLAVTVENALHMDEIAKANNEILRTKTFEAIAEATGESIHWVGNKAAPIPGSAQRVREDLGNLLAAAQTLIALPETERNQHPFYPVMQEAFEMFTANGIDLKELGADLSAMPPRRLGMMVGVESILEDLEIIEQSANTILSIKENLIGPAREQHSEAFELLPLLKLTAKSMGYPNGVLTTEAMEGVKPVTGDPAQIDRVFINLIKNAWEAMDGREDPHIVLRIEPADEQGFMAVRVVDNGSGISPENLEKIWMSFFTTKKDSGGTGLGLSACMQIISQNKGTITVDSAEGQGTTFSVLLPVA